MPSRVHPGRSRPVASWQFWSFADAITFRIDTFSTKLILDRRSADKISDNQLRSSRIQRVRADQNPIKTTSDNFFSHTIASQLQYLIVLRIVPIFNPIDWKTANERRNWRECFAIYSGLRPEQICNRILFHCGRATEHNFCMYLCELYG